MGAYNVDKGGSSLEESEILEPVHACLREVLERQRRGKSDNIIYSDHDIVAITLLYSQIVGNRLNAILEDECVSIGMAKKLSLNYSRDIENLTLNMTSINVSTYFDKE